MQSSRRAITVFRATTFRTLATAAEAKNVTKQSSSEQDKNQAPQQNEALRALTFDQFGRPNESIKLNSNYEHKNGNGQVVVEIRHAPVHSHDIEAIRGRFGDIKNFPAVGGSEGVGIVIDGGNSQFKKGDWVIPAEAGLGTWRSRISCAPEQLYKIRGDLHSEYAACLSSGLTALRLVEDFAQIGEDDVVLLNGGAGIIAQSIMQLANQRGAKVISFVRSDSSEAYTKTVERLKYFGAEIAIAEEYIQKREFLDVLADYNAPKIAFDCIGGKSATNLARLLGTGGTLVSYGNLSKSPVYIPPSLFIYKDIAVKSFNAIEWSKRTPYAERQESVDRVADLVFNSKLLFWLETYDLSDYQAAIENVSGIRKPLLNVKPLNEFTVGPLFRYEMEEIYKSDRPKEERDVLARELYEKYATGQTKKE